MILYNVTIKIDNEVHEEWLAYMQDTHIPDVMQTGCFLENRMSRIVIPADPEKDGISYSVQYLCASMAVLQQYQARFAPALQQEHTSRYEGKFVAFRSVMEVVSSMVRQEISKN
jgi:hypothetical protein